MTGGLKVGVTVAGDMPQADYALWSSGVTQNVVFLAMLLQRLPGVEQVVLVSCPGGSADCPLAASFGLRAIDELDAIERLDVLIELGVRGDAGRMIRFRERGGKLVSYVAGNVMAMNFEDLACKVPHGELMSRSGFDAVWVTPQHWRMNHSYLVMTRSNQVLLAPHIWSPACLLRSAARLGADLFWKARPTDQPWRVGIFDPNVNVLKTFHLPLLVCEEAYRRAPGLIDRVLLFSAAHLAQNIHVAEFCAATELGSSGRIFAEERLPIAQALGQHTDAVVTHQWENELNYLYWDALYAGWPLVHNSSAIADAGYYYPDFDPRTGGDVLVAALERHASLSLSRRGQDLEAIWRHHIDNPAIGARYGDLLEAVMS